MITNELLNDVHLQISKVENLIHALDLLVFDLDSHADGNARKPYDSVVGVKDALVDQIARAQQSYETLFPALNAMRDAA